MKRKLFIIMIVVVTVFAAFFFENSKLGNSENGTDLKLIQPPFVKSAEAAIASLGQEAGISAWYQGTALNLNNIKENACSAIEIESSDYIICSIPIPDYPDQYYPHVYVHKDGWILAYYMKTDPTSIMIDILSRSVDTTLLKTAVSIVASAGGSGFTDVQYYHFLYQLATNMLLVAEDDENGNYFTIKMPLSYVYFDRGWAWYRTGSSSSDYIKLTNTETGGVLNLMEDRRTWTNWGVFYGYLTASDMEPDVTYQLSVNSYWMNSYGVLILVYGVP